MIGAETVPSIVNVEPATVSTYTAVAPAGAVTPGGMFVVGFVPDNVPPPVRPYRNTSSPALIPDAVDVVTVSDAGVVAGVVATMLVIVYSFCSVVLGYE